jgi:hypothetical protein
MSSSLYPTGYDNFPLDKTNTTDAFDTHPDITNAQSDAVNKIEAELGLEPSGGYATVKDRLENLQAAIEGTGGGGNYITNPGFNDGLTGYTASDTLDLSSPGIGKSSVYAGKVTKAGSAGTLSITSARVAIPPSQVYTASVSVRIGSTGLSTFRSAVLKARFYDIADTLLTTVTGPSVNLSIQNVWARTISMAMLAPDTTAKVELSVEVSTAQVGEYYYFDEFQLEPGSTPTSFNSNFPQSALTGLMLAPLSVGIRELAVGSAKLFYGTLADIGTVTGMTDGSMYLRTDSPISLYGYFSGGWHLVAASENTVSNPGMFDIPFTADPRMSQATNMTMTANNIYYCRVQGQAVINGIGYHVGTADGANTLTFGVYDNSGTGRSAVPNNRKANVTTAVQAGTGYKTINFAAPVTVNHGDWFAYSTASTTLALMRAAAATASAMSLGLSLFQSGGGPAMPATVVAALFGEARTPILVGV